jgi:DNA repair exonuclease SbcCD ATPase subunit
MAERVSIQCPNCGRILLIPHQILGRGGRCRHCGHLFRTPAQDDSEQDPSLSSYYCPPLEAGAPDASESMLSSIPTMVLAPADEDGFGAAPRPEQFHVVARARRWLVAQAETRVGKLRPPDLKRWLVGLRSRAHWPWGHHNPSPALGRGTLEPDQERDGPREAADEWRSVLSAIREEAAEVNQLKQELRADLAEVERIRVQLKDAYPLAIDLSSRAALERIQELESLRCEPERLREEGRGLRAELETQAMEARERCAQLTGERDSARAERDRWKAEHAAIERELEQTRDISGAERDALAREVDQLQSRLGELERSQEEAASEHQGESAVWEARRKELEEASAGQRRALNEGEARLLQQLAGFEAERQFWRRQLDDCQERIERLQTDVIVSEQLRAGVEAQRDEAQAARRELERSHQAEHDRLVAALERAREAAEAAATALRPRPQACSFHDMEAFRSHLEQWLAEARARLQGLGANPDRPANQTLSRWLDYEIRIASEEIAGLDRERTMSLKHQAEEAAAPAQPASIEDASKCPDESHGD